MIILSSFNRLARWGFLGSVLLILTAVFLIPARSFQSHLGSFAPVVSQSQVALLLVSLIGASVCLLLQQASLPVAPVAAVTLKRSFGLKESRLFLIFNLVICAFILGRVAIQLDTPLDIDENIHALSIAQGRIAEELNPINTNPALYSQNHVAAQLLSVISVKMFGLSKLAVRGPAFLLTFLFLLALMTLTPKLMASPVLTFALANMALNQTVEWYMHSARGYIAMMVLTIVPFLVVWDFTLNRKAGSTLKLVLFGVCFALSVFTHMFGAIFNTLLFLSLLVWIASHRTEITEEAHRYALRMLAIAISIFPLFGFVIFHNLLFLSRIGDLNSVAVAPNIADSFMGSLGMSLVWQGKLLIVTLVLLLAHGWLNGGLKRKSLPLIFNVITLLFFVAAISALRTRVFESRFVLAFVAPFLLWVGESLSHIKLHNARRAATALACLPLVISPVFSSQAIYNSISHNLNDYDDFLREARKLTAPVPQSCFTFSGKRDVTIWARDFYFGDAMQGKTCARHFHVHIPLPQGVVAPIIETPLPARRRELLHNASGMYLLEALK